MCLRCLTSIELFMDTSFYASHPVLSNFKANSSFRNREHLFHVALSFDSTESCNVSALFEESVLNSENYTSASFVCILALSSALQLNTECYFPLENADVEDPNLNERLFKQTVYPREGLSLAKETLHIFRCTITPHKCVPTGTNHYVPLLSKEIVRNG